jgi:hypothetical protein|tara:strand:+ start:3692 stop:6601 length:2910 start_codon:yes stop_codon:yes gene_type:complete
MSKTSVELFIYPQFYDATWQPTAQNPTEYCPDGTVWLTAFQTTIPTSSATPLQDAINVAPPTAPDLWYGFASAIFSPFGLGANPFTAGVGINTYAQFSGWPAGLSNNDGNTGAYTWITGLSSGVNYDIDIRQIVGATSVSSKLTVMLFSTTGVLAQSWVITGTDITFPILPTSTFLSASTDYIVGWEYEGADDSIIKINIVSITEKVEVWSIDQLLSKGQVMLDLYNFEDVPLTLSVDNFTNAAEKVQSYSKAFKIPGTKRNNQILKNEYEITSSIDTTTVNAYDFNPLRKTQIYLQQEGYIIFEGFMKLISVDVKDGELSYNINLYSEVIALKDHLKTKKFNDLDFSELGHSYMKSSIKSSWGMSGLLLTNPLGLDSFAGTVGATNTTVLKYPYIDWDHQMVISNGTLDPSANVGMPEGVNLGSAFRPVINLKYILQNIFRDAGFTYTSTFIDSADFGNLFMDFNWGNANTPTLSSLGAVTSHFYDMVSTGSQPPNNTIPWTPSFNVTATVTLKQHTINNANTVSEVPVDYNETTGVYTATSMNQQVSVDYEFQIRNLSNTFGNTGGCDVGWVVNKFSGSPVIHNQMFNFVAYMNHTSWVGQVTVWLDAGDTFEPFAIQTWFTGSQPMQQGGWVSNLPAPPDIPTGKIEWTIATAPIVSQSLLSTLRGKLGQWDFISGLLQMFNLITMVNPQNPMNIIIETYDSIFNNITGSGLDLASRGINKDWTNKVDDQEWKFKPLSNIKKNTIFQYVEDKSDYVFKTYKDMFQGYLYGSYEIDASDYNILQGTQKIEAKPFAATLIKAYDSAFPWMITPAIYQVNDEGVSSAFDNAPRIMYDNGRKTIGPTNTFFFPSQNGEFGENFQYLYQMSNFDVLPPTATSNDLNYGTCQILNVNNPTVNTLFNRFWANYFSQLYNPDTRSLTLKINLTPADINQFSFSDLVMIKNRAFRVNKIDYKPGDLAKVELILIT